MNATNQGSQKKIIPTLQGDPHIIYADRIVNFSVGIGTSKLTYGVELEKDIFSPAVTVVIPTMALIEGIDFILNAIDNNNEIKANLNLALDQFKSRINRE